jgi:hypothetical protein
VETQIQPHVEAQRQPQDQLPPYLGRITSVVKVAIGFMIAVQAWQELVHVLRRASWGAHGRWDRYEHTEMRMLHLLELGYLVRRLSRLQHAPD